MDFNDLPQHFVDYTPEQVERMVVYLAKKPLLDLRKRQAIIQAQIEVAHHRADNEPSNRPRMLVALADLQAFYDHTSAAIMRKGVSR